MLTRKNKGFTLLEIVVAMGIFSICVAMGLGIISYALEQKVANTTVLSIQDAFGVASATMAEEIKAAKWPDYSLTATDPGWDPNAFIVAPTKAAITNTLTFLTGTEKGAQEYRISYYTETNASGTRILREKDLVTSFTDRDQFTLIEKDPVTPFINLPKLEDGSPAVKINFVNNEGKITIIMGATLTINGKVNDIAYVATAYARNYVPVLPTGDGSLTVSVSGPYDANGVEVVGPWFFTNTNYSYSASPSGGTAPYTYAWSDGETTSTATNYFWTIANTTYTPYVVVTDASGQSCKVFAGSIALINGVKLTVIISPAGAGTVTANPPGGVYAENTVVTLTASPSAAYTSTLPSWTGDANGTGLTTTVNMGTTAKTVTATFTFNTYTLTYMAGANGTISGTTSQTIEYGHDGTLVTAVANTGYHFVNWNDGLSTAARTDTSVTSNMLVAATFAANVSGNITIAAGTNGTVDMTTTTLTYDGSAVTITATPNAGYYFVSWAVTANPSYINISNTSTAATTITATNNIPQGGTATVTATFATYWTHTGAVLTGYTGPGGGETIPGVMDGVTITSIGKYAVAFYSSLTSVTIPDSVTSIGTYAFVWCDGLTSVIVGSGVTSIGDGAFNGCVGLTSFTVDANNSSYSSNNGSLFNKAMTTLICYACGTTGAYVIPASVTSIGNNAFYYCSGLTDVTIPNSVTSIGNAAFVVCSSLTNVTIPSSVTSIGDQAFSNCYALTSMTIPSSVTSIGYQVFSSCYALTSVTIPSSVTSIGNNAFQACGLTSVIIPNSVTSIGNYAFEGCYRLTSVTIGSGVTSIGDRAFYGCSKLEVANFLGNAPTGTTTVFTSCKVGFCIYYLNTKTGWIPPTWYGFPIQTITLPTVTVTGPTSGGGNTNYTYTPIVIGGVAPYTYAWSSAGGSPGTGAGGSFITQWSTLGVKTVALTITDSGGQIASATLGVTISSVPTVTISGTTIGKLATDYIYTPIITGGLAPYTYAWTDTYYKAFTSSGTWTVPAGVTSIKVLVVAGGGGGGGFGGGGAGGYQYDATHSIGVGTFSVTVGGGGGGAASGSVRGTNGSDSVFDTITAVGGGGGGAFSDTNLNGANGGSGGGAGTDGGGNGYTSGSVGLGTSGQGHNGGLAVNSATASGAGGGAGAVGGGGSGTTGGNGGAGTANSISGASVTYAGGGGASGQYGAGTGGSGGGGNGGINSGGSRTAGTANTGGGGGGGYATAGMAGGSGIVIIQYSINTTSATLTTQWLTAGAKTVNLTVTDSLGQTASATPLGVTIYAAPTVTISGPTPCKLNTAYTYTPTITGGLAPYAYAWTGSYSQIFTSSGSWTVPAGVTSVQVVVVGGGGSGGNNSAGGGGAGGYVYTSAFPVSAGASIPVTIGDGGAAVSSSGVGKNGQDSIFSTIVAKGGGGGNGGSGGSGGGAQAGGAAGGNALGTQGHNGGASLPAPPYAGGGGGGASTVGASVVGISAGAGGAGITNPLTGTILAGGGGGGGNSGPAASANVGGVGGGGAGTAVFNGTATAGTPNTGGGGGGSPGGGDPSQSGAGGSGIVIIQYSINTTSATLTTQLATMGTANINLTITDSLEQIAISNPLSVAFYSAPTVTLSGPTSGVLNTNYTYTPTVTGGLAPYTYNWTGNYYKAFTSSGSWTVPAGVTSVQVVVVAGGGSGGSDVGGGGGAGGYAYTAAFPVSAGASIPITIGLGGAAVGVDKAGNNGQDSVFSTLIAKGGGSGSGYGQGISNASLATSGGSGGGGSTNGLTGANALGTQGNKGGNGLSSGTIIDGGGGGGASAAGANGAAGSGGSGGNGIVNPITGTTLAGGGGGGGYLPYSQAAGAGGSGGGGAGSNVPQGTATSGSPNSGGGGGGSSGGGGGDQSGAGGSGIVIIQYSTCTASTLITQWLTAGAKTVALTVTDALGQTGSATLGVTSYSAPVVTLSGSTRVIATPNMLGSLTNSFNYWGTMTGISEYFTAPNSHQGVHLNISAYVGGGVNWYNSGNVGSALPSTVYTVSATIKYTGTPNANLFYLRKYRADGSQISEGGLYSSSNQVSLGNGWYRASATFTTESDCTSFLIQGYEYYINETWIYDLQCEQGSGYTYTPVVSGGLAPYTYAFSGGENPATQNGSTNTFTTQWASAGAKTIALTVTDALGQTGSAILPVTASTALYFPLAVNAKDTTGTISPSTELNTSYYNGAVWVGQATTNLYTQVPFASIYNNYGVPATMTTLSSETYLGQPISRESMTPNAGSIAGFQTEAWSHGVYGNYMTFAANTTYAVSVYWRPISNADTHVSLCASNIGGWTDITTEVLPNGWRRSSAYRAAEATAKSDAMFFSFWSPSLTLGSTHVMDWTCPQLEAGVTFSSPFVVGTRGVGVLYLPIVKAQNTNFTISLQMFGRNSAASDLFVDDADRWNGQVRSSGGSVELLVRANGRGTTANLYGTLPVPSYNSWNRYTLVSIAGYGTKIYQNTTLVLDAPGYYAQYNSLSVGRNGMGDANVFGALFKNLVVMDTALSQAQIAELCNTFTLTYTAGANGTISGTTPQTVNSGASGTAVTAKESIGYHFVNWSDAVVTAARTDTNVTANITVTANFALGNWIHTGAVLTGYTGPGGAETMPSVIDGVTITSIGASALNSTQGHLLTSISIPSSVTSIGSSAFAFCDALTSVTIPSSVTSIGDKAFNNCPALTSIVIPEGVTSIGNAMFEGCYALTSVTLPTSLTSIGTWAFNSCTSLVSVIIPANVTIIDASAFNNCTALTSVTIGAGVTSIGSAAFHLCTALSNVTIPSSVTTIGASAFQSCSNLTVANFLGNAPIGATSVFLYCKSGFYIHYLNTTTGWVPPTWYGFPIQTTFMLTYAAGTNGTISGTSPQTVNSGTSGTAVTAVPATGYHFVAWSDAVATTARTDTNVTANITVTATFAINTYTLTYTAGANGTISGTTPQTVNYGASGTAVTAIPATGYHFVAWSDSVATAARTDSNITADKAVTATFAINTYSITVSAGANGSISPVTGTVNYGATPAYTITPSTGYHIETVTVDAGAVSATSPYTFTAIAATHTISATFAINTYTITASSGSNGTVTPAGVTQKNYWESQTYTITPATGYYIASLTVDGGAVTVAATYTFANITINHTINATFAINTYTITVSAGANGAISPATGSVNYGATPAYTITPATGYSIASVTVDGGSVAASSPYTFTAIAANHSISATFAINTYTITASTGSNGTVTPAEVTTKNFWDSQTYTITPSTGYSIASLTVDGSAATIATTYTFANITINHTISATFAINTYTLTYTAGANGTLTGTTPQTVNYGTSGTTVTAVPSTGYHFVAWSDAVATAARTDTNVTANITVTATFAINTYTVTFNKNGGDTEANPTAMTVNYNVSLGTLPTVPTKTGSTFVSWNTIAGGEGTTFTGTTPVVASITVYAQWTVNSYTVTFNGNGGTPNPTSKSVTYAATYGTLATATRTGYTFNGWFTATTGGTQVTAASNVTITADQTLWAQWTINTFTITASTGSKGTVTPVGVTTKNYGNTQAYVITPSTGYHIASVTVDGGAVAATSPYTFTAIAANHTISATFGINTYTLAYTVGTGGSPNLLANGNFETDIAGWSGNSITLSRETGAPLAGTGSLKVLFTGTSGWTQTGGTCVIGHTYNLTARVKSTAAAGRLTRWIIYNGATATGASVNCSTESTITLTFVATGTNVVSRIERVGGGAANEYLIIDSVVCYDVTGGTISGTSPQTVNYGASGTSVTAVASTSYHFVAWSDAVATATRTDTNVTANKSVTANFAINTYTVTFNKNGGDTEANPTAMTVNYNVSLGTLPTAPTKTGATFASWNTLANGTGTTFTEATPVIAGITVYAIWTSSVTIQSPTADTYIDLENPDNNAGTTPSLFAGYYQCYRSLLSFDFSAVVPVGAVVTKATLSLYDFSPNDKGNLIIFRLLRTDWAEGEATWNEFKTGSAWAAAGAQDVETDFTWTDAASAATWPSSEPAWVNWDVTAQVETARDIVGGVAHFLLADFGTPLAGYDEMFSREHTGDLTLRPKLYIEYTLPSAGSTVTFDSQGGTPTPSPITGIASGATVTLPTPPTKTSYTFGGWWTATGGGGSQFTTSTPVTADITVYAGWTSSVTIQSATKDTFLDEAAKTTNYGTNSMLEVSGYGGGTIGRMLVTFDFSAAVPAGAVINVATLSLYAFTGDASDGMPIKASRLLRTDWVEGQATWNIYKTGSPWGAIGCLNAGLDYDTVNEALATFPTPSAAGWLNWDVKRLCSVTGTLNLVLGTTQAGWVDFRSSNYADASYRPKLYIEYTLP